MKLEILLLGVLANREATGYELKRFFDTDGRVMRSNTTMSQVYRTLAGMERRGWVTHRIEERTGALDAKRYTITELGICAIQDWIASPYEPPSRFQDPDFFARLAYTGLMSDEEVIALIDIELETRLRERAKYRNRARPPMVRPAFAPDDYNYARTAEIGEWMHRRSGEAMDRHIEALVELRMRLLDSRPLNDPAPTTDPAADTVAKEGTTR